MSQMIKESIIKDFIERLEFNQNIIHKICHIYANNNEEKKDLRQEIIYQLWKSYAYFKNEAKFTTWMYQVALNTALLSLRMRKKEINTIVLEERHEMICDDQENETVQKVRKLYRAIKQLGKVDRAIIFLYLEKCSYQRISEIMGITRKNVSVRLTRIRERLRNSLLMN
jgi:RNA polymerase sigma-70 factor (ECF subfamily)